MRGTQPAVEVELGYAGATTRAVAIVDSGSIWTLFSSEVAEMIGIEDVTAGHHDRVATLAGARDVYFFDVELRVVAVDQAINAQIGFFGGRTPRNILGRSVFFSAYEVGFRETAGELYLLRER